MEVVGGVASIMQLIGTAKAAVRYVDDVKGSIEDRQALSQEVSTLQSLLAELESRIRGVSQHNNPNPSSSILSTPALKGPLDQVRTSLQELTLLLVPSGSSSSPRRAIRNLAWRMRWPTKRKSATELLQRVTRAKIYIGLVLQQDTWASTNIIEQNTAFLPAVKRQASHIESGVEKLALEVEDKLRKDVISWMSPINFFVSQKDILTRYQSGTCEAILGSPQINLWMLGKGSRLLCSGIPGSGKTIFSALILQHLQQKHSASIGIRIAGLFCNYKEKDLQTPANLLAGIWRQLAYDRSRLSDDVVGLYRSNAEKGTRPSLSETTSVLTREINQWSKVFVVIDAIDECDPDIVPSILRILDIPHVNILVTSRLPGSGPLASYASLSIQPSALDLRLYIESRLSESSLMSRHCEKDPSLRDEVVSTVIHRASGMFLMARYHMDLVLGQDSVRRVRQALVSLPRDLNSAYAGILERVYSQEPHKSHRSRQLIAWILFSTRPLSIEETRCALSVEPEDSSLDQDGLPDLDALLATCSGIISINTETQHLSFVHQTFAQYLMQAPPVPLPTAHLNIARTCITYLLFDTFSGGRCLTDIDMDARLLQNPFFLYSAQNWGKHTRMCGEAVPDLEPLIKQLLSDTGHRESSLQSLLLPAARYEGYSWTAPKHAPPLWLAAFFGLPATTNLLLRDGGCLTDSEASDGSTALSMAAKSGFTDVMTILLDHGAEPGGSRGVAIPLLEAARRGQTEAVSLLLERGADIDGKLSNGRTALHEAVGGGRDTTLFLLDKGADANARTRNLWSVLHSAVAAREEEFVSQLLHHGATLDTQTSEGETALHIAASRGFDSIISRLVDAGAAPGLVDIKGDTALHTAASRGFVSACSLLIQSGSKSGINAQNNNGETPIYQAAMAGHAAVVEFLLDRGADCKVSNSEGTLPLHQAAWIGCLPGVIALLNTGHHHINTADERGRTCLHGAAAGGFVDVVNYLIQHGADSTLTYGPGPIILWKALSYYKHDSPRHRLLKYMSGQVSRTKDRITALDEALGNSHTEVAAMLRTASSASPGVDLDVDIDDRIGPGVENSVEALLSPPFLDGKTGGAYKRIRKELREMLDFVGSGSEVFALPVGEDLKIWEGVIMGPSDTSYRGGLFFLSIQFPDDYPFDAPRIRFTTKIFHTNINEFGGISLDILKSKSFGQSSQWSPALTMRKCLMIIRSLLEDPNAGFPEATHLFETNRAGYYAKVQEWTRRYAMEYTTG